MSNSLFNPLIYGIFHLWKPRRKELQRGISSRRTLLTNLSFERRRSSNGTILNGSIGNNNRLGNGATVHGKHGSLLTTTHSTAGTISMGGTSTLKKHCLDENHHENHRNLQQQPHHHLNVMPSSGGGVHQLLSGTQGTDGQQNSTTSSVCICSNKNGNGTIMEDNV
ncbi:unnamed protein product [Orchesella dallaii]|uniref:Uncharacterized protein n=1 Tax=Orchesella dallaii TaxID=48710 RepID=A0ABP1QWW7_9HEXA